MLKNLYCTIMFGFCRSVTNYYFVECVVCCVYFSMLTYALCIFTLHFNLITVWSCFVFLGPCSSGCHGNNEYLGGTNWNDLFCWSRVVHECTSHRKSLLESWRMYTYSLVLCLRADMWMCICKWLDLSASYFIFRDKVFFECQIYWFLNPKAADQNICEQFCFCKNNKTSQKFTFDT